MASTDEPQKIKIGGAGYIFWLLILPLIVFIILLVVTIFYPNSVPPGSFTITPQIDPISGNPLPLDPMALALQSIINGATFGGVILIVGSIYVLKRR